MTNLLESLPCDKCVDPAGCQTQCKIHQTKTQTDTSLEEYRKQAMSLWFEGGSCTGGKPE
jgi:hypothetical protein